MPLQVEITSVEITSTQVRRVAAGLAAGLATGVALLGIFDILKPARAPSAGMLLFQVLVPTMVPGLVALLAYLAGVSGFAEIRPHCGQRAGNVGA